MPYKVFNAAMPTGSVAAKVTTGSAAVKTMLQLAPPSTRNLEILSWGYTLDAVPSAASTIELIQTDTAATVTPHNLNAIYNSDPNGPTSLLTVGAAATGFTASGEGTTPTVTRLLDVDQISSTAGAESLNQDYQFVLDERPVVAAGKFLRIRVNFGGAVNMLCWVTFRELG